MEYICLRDCFVHDTFHYEGNTYNLPPGEDPKNFKPVIPIEEALNPPQDEPSTEPAKEAKPKKKKKKS